MEERKRPTQWSMGRTEAFFPDQLIFGLLLVLLLFAFRAAAVSAGAEQAVIFYSPG